MKLYYTFNQLKSDLPYLKDVKIKVANDFDKSIQLDSYQYKSLLKQIKSQNIKIIVETPEERIKRSIWKRYNRDKGNIK